MKKISFICSAALVIASMGNIANAQTVRKSGSGMVLSGTFNTTVLGVTTPCTITATYNVPNVADSHSNTSTPPFEHSLSTDNAHGGGVTLASFAMSGSAACSLATLTGTPTIAVSPTTITISGINARAIGGLVTCAGSITGAYHHVPGGKSYVTFTNQTIGACTFSGTLTAQNNGEFDIDATPATHP
ncbi:hypothetical protein [Edaphosphingomonas haloaromaticamans]|uniref:Uncharacterized protein n=1 Tax=Edaphosphingomonas haloaromaticamans TaxID=653954 RepID=A0A1S1HBU6_9SPHN|nr:MULTISPECIES: hypothetical protein [Sphingomonas]MDX3885462.1 hypothetical protein [Sphingomonas sp.]OHT18763.1 hypothetical protein BHE75_00739 [Sphingomonas haloaromaticamans]